MISAGELERGRRTGVARTLNELTPSMGYARLGALLLTLLALLALLALPGCLPLLAPHGEVRGNIGFAAGRTRTGTSEAARLSGNVDAVYLPTTLLGCDREFDLGVGARFHFVEPERAGLSAARIGGVVSGSWLFFREPFARGELRFDVDALELDNRVLGGVSVALGIELIGEVEGDGVWGSWEGLFAGAWSGEAGLRIEAMAGYHEDFGDVRYATFTIGLAGRWPAGGGVVGINPIYLAIAAGNASSSSATSTAGSSSTTGTSNPPSSSSGFSNTHSEVRGCPAAPATAGGEVPVGEEVAYGDGLFHCTASDGSTDDVVAEDRESAERACDMSIDLPCTCDPTRR